jgi:adenylate cyclase
VPGILANVPVLDAAAAGRGLFTIRPERDGIVRRVPLAMRAEGVIVPTLGLEMLRVAAGGSPLIIRSDAAGIRSVGVRGLELPTDRNGQIWVRFSPHDPRRYVSAQAVLAGEVPRDSLEGKLVLIGTSAIGLLDRQTTPIDPSMPGVEIHALLLENALNGSWISYPNYALGAELSVAVLDSSAMIVLVPILGAATVLTFGAAIATTLVALSWYLFWQHGILIDFTYPLLASLAVYLVLVFTNYLREQAQRKRIRSAFGQYLSPALVEQLVQEPGKLVLGGEQREMTIMFSDVRGFTAISEMYKDDPQGLTALMNRLLTPLTNAIIEQRGTIDKYMGDAVMAFWNAPLPDPHHPRHACRAALAMCVALNRLNDSRAAEAREHGQAFVPIRIGIGVNTGACVVGNMGSDLRFDYSVLGDTVNLTSRIEGQTKTYGVTIVAGASTVAAVASEFAALELDLIRVKGKTEPEVIYSIFGGEDVAARVDFRELTELNARLLNEYRGRAWAAARETLQRCRAFEQTFELSRYLDLYAARIDEFVASPPPADWDGVFVATNK